MVKNREARKKWKLKRQETGGKICIACGKCPPEGFPITKFKRPGSRCTPCQARLTRYYKNNKEAIRSKQKTYYETPRAQEIWAKNHKAQMEKFYGLFPGQKDILHEMQEGKCAICYQQFDVLAVDHNHETGKIRSLLCKPCNLGLGNFRESTSALQRAIDYLNYWRT